MLWQEEINIAQWGAPFLKILVILVAALVIAKIGKGFITKIVKTFIQKGIKKETKISKERMATLTGVFNSFFNWIVWIIAILTILPELGINIAPLLASIGVAGLALGIGARSLIQDYLSGICILLEDQYRIGEKIEIEGKIGEVKDLNLRRTLLLDPKEKKLYFIPNGIIKTVANFSRLSEKL
ncbi:MAG: small-conductance mechanosensitive channel [Candidatus Nealsonbacteria bacterium CG_4_9_14_3_um_filter_35_11]|nr:MAG: small-conductance mechanosensitive channel [Candidatus Nealsonbacteria bacterium CG_4_9_14_3_um_filter_35_11]